MMKLGFINDSMQTNYNRSVAVAKATYIVCALHVRVCNEYCASYAGSLHSYSLSYRKTFNQRLKGEC